MDGSEIDLSRITSTPGVCGGRPCIRGTRVRVADIVGALAVGETVEEILADFDYLSAADIYSALAYAAAAIEQPTPQAA